MAEKNENRFTAITRLGCSVAVFIFLITYLWGIQLSYDSVNVKKEPWLKLVLFALTIVGAGLSYDWAKAVGSLPERRFWAFFSQLGWTLFFAAAALLCGAVSVAFANAISPLAALVMYFATLVFVTLAINSTTKLVEGSDEAGNPR